MTVTHISQEKRNQPSDRDIANVSGDQFTGKRMTKTKDCTNGHFEQKHAYKEN